MAKRYQKMLLAVDFHEDNAEVIAAARELRELYGAELHLVHVNEPLGMAYAGETRFTRWKRVFARRAKRK